MGDQHTPGPWGLDYDLLKGRHILVIGGDYGICKVFDEEPGARAINEANAHLIAAAPELLQALLTARDYVADSAAGKLAYQDSGDGFVAMAGEDLAGINAAIAKAQPPKEPS